MFEILKNDVKINDKVKLLLITGKEPEGTVISIGENFILLQNEDGKENRIFDRLIGGWEVVNSAKMSSPQNETVKKKINQSLAGEKEKKRTFKSIEKNINDLIRQSAYDEALKQISVELNKQVIDKKYKSSLLLKRAQIYSSNNNPKLSEESYQQLIRYNEEIGSPTNNLSHLYTELARLQALDINKQKEAVESVEKALELNPNNNFAINLLRQFEKKTSRVGAKNNFYNNDEHLLIDADEESTTISKMIDIDIREYKYTHTEIIRNGGKPTAFIAKNILQEAKKTRKVDFSERFPIYLEAAKAFSELNVGSYDLQDYLESVAYYSMLKGNSLFIQFRNAILKGDENSIKIIRLRDSACSYYIESLNLLSNIEPKVLVSILSNYLKLYISTYYFINNIKLNYESLFKDNFTENFRKSVLSGNKEVEEIAYKVIVDFGASSFSAWNSLANTINGTGFLYRYLQNNDRKLIFSLINEIERNSIDVNNKPGEFLKRTFQARKESVKMFISNLSKISSIDLEPHNILTISDFWNKIIGFEKHITLTDLEIKKDIDKIIELLRPYLNRSEKERVNILLQIKSLIEKQIKFISENTTFYGRTLFFGLLGKWKNDIDEILQEKIAQSYPKLEILVDPPYLIETEDSIFAPLIIKNIGDATAEGFELNIHFESTVFENKVVHIFEEKIEITSGGKIEINIQIPEEIIAESNAVEIKIKASTIYQSSKMNPLLFEFTVEREPDSILMYEDIPWRDGPIPPEHLFKGRRQLIADLAQHYLSIEKDKPYILYGLTRTGKSSILNYLKIDLEGSKFYKKEGDQLILTFSWDFSEAASYKKAADFWNYLLYQKTFEELEKYSTKYNFNLGNFRLTENVRAKDFRSILDFMQQNNLYPIFFIDEFSFVKTLIDEGTVNSAFLQILRQHSLNELASFIFAGTYDIKELIRDGKYGITGQLVNAIEEQVNEISDESSEELIKVLDEKLSFTPEAIDHIKFLSGRVPYFIQIICKNCGYYAVENKRRVIGYPEVEKVIRILIGHMPPSSKSLVKKLPENVFQNNQFGPTDPKEINVLISSLAIFNKDNIIAPRGVGFDELQQLWAKKGITAFRPKLAEAINLLKEKKIIKQKEDEGIPVYLFSVDLFRRWWANHNPDLNLILSTLLEDL